MSTKTDFYQTFNGQTIDMEKVREFQRSHPSLQVRRAGNARIQVRFHDHERFTDATDWLSDFRSRSLNALCSQLSICSKLVPQDEVLQSMFRSLPMLEELTLCEQELKKLKESVELEKRNFQRLENEYKGEIQRLRESNENLRAQYLDYRTKSENYLNCLVNVKFRIKEGGVSGKEIVAMIQSTEDNS